MTVFAQINLQPMSDVLEVTAPYLAFAEVTALSESTYQAHITPEQPLYNELGPISACEVGRHLALLGAASAALNNERPGKHYYLATQATLIGNPLPQKFSNKNGALIARMNALELGTKQAKATTELLTPCEQQLFALDVHYQIVPARLFARMFKTQRMAGERHGNPFATSPYAIEQELHAHISTQARFVSAPYVVTPEVCAGHFPEYPCLPVAILMGHMGRSAGAVLANLHNAKRAKYQIVGAEIAAHQLVFAGTTVRFEAELVNRQGNRTQFNCRALDADGTLYGEMSLALLDHEEENQ